MAVSLLIDPVTRAIFGRGWSNDPGMIDHYIIVSDSEAAKLMAGPVLSASVDTNGIVTVVPLPPPAKREKTNQEMLADWNAAQDTLATALTDWTTQVNNFTTARTGYTAHRTALTAAATPAAALPEIRACFDQLDTEMQAIANGLTQIKDSIDAVNTKLVTTAKAVRLVAPDRV